MKTKKHNLRVGDVLYSVDPQKLLVTKSNVTEINNGYGNVVCEQIVHFGKSYNQIWIAIDSFPVECNSVLYFTSEEEAEKFIKTQIGAL